MLPAIAIAMFLGSVLSHGRKIVDFTNDILNNVVSIAGDAHQAKVAQDIFRQEIRYERSLQMRDDIRDMNKLMMESVSSTLFLGSILLGTCFVTVIEGFPPLNSSRMVVAWWLFFAVWSINYSLLAIWFALSFQLRISSSARERLLRRYRYRLPDDSVITRMGGQNLVNTMFRLNAMVVEHLGQLVSSDEAEDPQAPAESGPEAPLRVKVRSLDPQGELDCAALRKGLHAWTHSSGEGLAWPKVLDVPFFLLGETVVRSRWHFQGDRPLLLRVRGEATLYVAAQCPPLGGATKEHSASTMLGMRKAIGADLPEWPAEELPICTAGFHPAWRGPDGHGIFQRVEGYRIFVDANGIETPVYKLVLAAPPVPGGSVDVILCWRFKQGCEALLVMLRKGQVHCKEEDWPIAEFNDEVCQFQPLQYYSSFFLRRSVVCLAVNVAFAVLSKIWVLGERPMWWLEPALMAFLMLPVLITIYAMPISSRTTQEALSMPVVNRAPQMDVPVEEAASAHAKLSKWDDLVLPATDAEARLDSPPRVPRQSSGRRQSAGCEDGAVESARPLRHGRPPLRTPARGAAGDGPLRISVVEQDAPAGLLFTCNRCAPCAPCGRERLPGPEAYRPAPLHGQGAEVVERSRWARLPEPLDEAPRKERHSAAAAPRACSPVLDGPAPRVARLCPSLAAAARRALLGAPASPGAPPSSLGQRLHALTCLFDALFLAAALAILASPIVDWGQAPLSLGPAQIPASAGDG